jgi:hypothetical protein
LLLYGEGKTSDRMLQKNAQMPREVLLPGLGLLLIETPDGMTVAALERDGKAALSGKVVLHTCCTIVFVPTASWSWDPIWDLSAKVRSRFRRLL